MSEKSTLEFVEGILRHLRGEAQPSVCLPYNGEFLLLSDEGLPEISKAEFAKGQLSSFVRKLKEERKAEWHAKQAAKEAS